MNHWLQYIFRPVRADWPDYYHAYREATPRRSDKKQHWLEADYVVLDTESTGFDLRKDGLLSIGAVRVEGGEIPLARHFDEYIQQGHVGNQETARVHGIRREEVADARPEAEVLRDFLDFCKGSILVAHHAGFDIGMLNQALDRCHPGMALVNPVIDTLNLARRAETTTDFYSRFKQHDLSLDGLCRQYHIPMHDRHTAAGDALMTAILFLKLGKRLEKKGYRSLGEMLKPA